MANLNGHTAGKRRFSDETGPTREENTEEHVSKRHRSDLDGPKNEQAFRGMMNDRENGPDARYMITSNQAETYRSTLNCKAVFHQTFIIFLVIIQHHHGLTSGTASRSSEQESQELHAAPVSSSNAHGSTRGQQHHSTVNGMDKFEILKMKLFESLDVKHVGEKDKEIILPQAVKDTWALKCHHEFYTCQAWYNPTWDADYFMDDYLRIMSILIFINFPTPEWRNFKSIFIDRERKDEHLPFPQEVLQNQDFLGKLNGKNFFERQWAFCPIRVYEREEPFMLKGRQHLPWIDEPIKIGDGASGVVRKQTLAAHFLIYNNQGVNPKVGQYTHPKILTED